MRTAYLLLMAAVAHGAVLDRVALVVGNAVITESEVIDEVRLNEFLESHPLDLSAPQKRAAADRLVDQQLIRRDMETANYQPSSATEAAAMLSTFRQQHFRTDTEFRSALSRYGITEEQLKSHLRWELTVIRYTDQRFRTENSAPDAQSADRQDPTSADKSGVDTQLEAWLKEARSSISVVFKAEAFQ